MDNTINKYFISPQYIKKVSTPAMIKQERWRRQQIKKYYHDGRPIFGTYQARFHF
tara:strand:- start:543 stop:707 length:165 start_codon:yes stop_codon:yes gene_type:complete